MRTALTIERLRELLHYDQSTGVFTRLIATGYRNCHKAGKVVGSFEKDSGYVCVSVDGHKYWAHRLAWFYVHGQWPEHDIDHKDRVRHHNWIDNLRHVSRALNLQNQVDPAPTNTSGIRGVHWAKDRKKWQVDISVNGKNRHVGRFDSKEAAAAAYLSAKASLHPGYIA